MKERDLMKRWAKDNLKKYEKAKPYWLRIPDGPVGIKPADGVVFAWGAAAMVEFKVDRRVNHEFKESMLTPHQLTSLKEFRGYRRDSFVVVFHQKKEHVYRLSSEGWTKDICVFASLTGRFGPGKEPVGGY